MEEMVLEQGDFVANGSSAASITSSHRPPSTWWPFGWTTQDSQDIPAPVFTSSETRSAPVSNPTSVSVGKQPSSSHAPSSDGVPVAGAENFQPPPNSVPWWGLWPWGNEASSSSRPKTEAELIKEEAMARDTGALPTPPLSSETVRPSDTTPRPQEFERNPIAQDLIENRASWTSFFSLKAAHGSKRLALDVEGDEEVMDLSGDPDLPPSPSPVNPFPANFKAKGSNLLVLKATSGSSTPAKGRSSSVGPMKDDLKKKVADSTKARSSSASPSRRSAAPKVANMVLPTFEETFYTLPRALPPYTRPTSLKKMGKLVSGVLGINTDSTGRRSRMKEWQRERGVQVPRDYEGLRASREVGKDFPRVGEVLGMPDVGGIRDCKRVAILGVHGWVLFCLFSVLAVTD